MTARSSIIRVSVVGEAKGLSDTFKKSAQQSQSFGQKMKTAGAGITRNVTLPLLGAATGLVALANKQEDAERKMESTFKSMGAAAWTNTDALKANASALQEQTTFGDETILGLQDLLLTFGNVTNKIGEGNDIFDRATQTGLDMSAALGQDLKSSAVQLGKALNDPILGITALSRVGVSFTEDQKDMIRTLQESGDTLGAQKIILGELEKQFGGTAAALAETSQGKLKQAMNTLGDLGEVVGAQIATVAATAIPNFVAGIEEVFDVVRKLPGPIKVLTVGLGALLLALAAVAAHPVIAALGVVAGAITLIGANARASEDQVAGLKDELNEMGRLSLTTVAEILGADSVRELEETGVSVAELRDAVMEGGEAFEEVEKKIRSSNKWALSGARITDDLTGSMEFLRDIVVENSGALDDEAIALQKAADQAKSTGGFVGNLTGSYGDLTGAVEESIDATTELADEQRKAIDPLFALRDATEQYQEAEAKVQELKRSGMSSGDEYLDALEALVDAQGDLNYATENYESSAATGVAALFALGREAGLTDKEIQSLIDSLKELNRVPIVRTNPGGTGFKGDPDPIPTGQSPAALPATFNPGYGQIPPIQVVVDGKVIAEAAANYEQGLS